ncbi:putative phosphoheptose isomerase [Magnetococcus marinus MC-1]|uniref:Putative phosphoheptose isomerase n=1 Tax=Magnetococcus marinus (strain ATCC BAA-1437 / JCM 17883 / MC-1) TaxID=156889 RepID=A0LA06_MAGMM|nr:SIS domain-containing protein [Magnetococcus marinus]ABK44799.1 putative phosphoheptose isomerase [Magnetococcus marinus MC-1]
MSATVSHWLDKLQESLQQTNCHLQGRPCSRQRGFERTQQLLEKQQQQSGQIWWIGNGGSNALCSHLSQDMINKLALRSHTFSDASLLTCMANDNGYAAVFLEPLKKLARPGDLLIAISSSGNSENILCCGQWALDNGLDLITLSAFAPDNALWQLPAQVAFHLPCTLYGHAEVGHEALLHGIIETLWLNQHRQPTPQP